MTADLPAYAMHRNRDTGAYTITVEGETVGEIRPALHGWWQAFRPDGEPLPVGASPDPYHAVKDVIRAWRAK